MRLFPSLLLAGLLAATPLVAAERSFTILHSNDWQSRLLGFGPNNEYTPATANDDDTVGGVARLATLLKARRDAAGVEPVLLLDGGDFTMGTLFHTIAREMGSELRLMSELGYDAAVIGNHEFDFRPAGLAAMISAAHKAKGDALVPLLSSNMRFDPASKADDSLQAHVEAGRILPYKLIERGGIRFGLFGLLGNDAVAVSPMIKPLTFADPVATARETVAKLREEGAEVVILLSHMGVTQQADGSWRGEDVELVEQVPGIDIVVGGHSHVALPQPVLVGGHTPVVQAGSEIQYLGELRMTPRRRRRAARARLPPASGQRQHRRRRRHHHQGGRLQAGGQRSHAHAQGLPFRPAAGQGRAEPGPRFHRPDPGQPGDRCAAPCGGCRPGLHRQRHHSRRPAQGPQWRAGTFPTCSASPPLGIGEFDDEPGYPMIKAYVSTREIKSLLEVLLLAYQLRDSQSYYPRVAGVRFTYNPWRVPFDRVSRIEIGDAVNGYRDLDLDDTRLYSIGATSYVGSFTWLVPELTQGLLDVIPKDVEGRPLPRIEDAIVDQDPARAGVQELKEWQALLDHIRSLPDLDGDGLADIPTTGVAAEERMIRAPSLHPAELFRLAGPLQWGVSGVIFACVLLILWLLSRRLRRRR
jgi:5'-nucleotidase/UDP-sugar diphosphatase